MASEAHARTHSIGARLTLLYTLVALVAMALFAAVAYWRLSSNFRAEHARFLQIKMAELQTDYGDGGGRPEVLLGEIAKETDDSRLRQYQARVIAADGQILGGTPGMARELPGTLFPKVGDGGSAIGNILDWRAGDHVYALATFQLHGHGAATVPRVQLAMNISRDDRLMADFRNVMLAMFLLLTPLLAIAGRWVSAHGLAPVKRIVDAAREVMPTRLSARIPMTPPWPSELGELVRVFNAMLTRLEEAFSRLSRFSADLAHELRTPLSNMSGELEVCLLRPRTTEVYRAAIESSLDECRRLNVLVDNLLFMARAEHAGLALRTERFDAGRACSWVMDQHVPGAAMRGIRLVLEGTAEITADPVLFRQAVANLLTNAIRHSRDDGEIRITLRPLNGGELELRVRDHGEGISAEHLPHLFDRFYQADPARTRESGQGTGLGLSIVKTIVDLHGGRAAIDSTLSMGTTVTLLFPASTETPAG